MFFCDLCMYHFRRYLPLLIRYIVLLFTLQDIFNLICKQSETSYNFTFNLIKGDNRMYIQEIGVYLVYLTNANIYVELLHVIFIGF